MAIPNYQNQRYLPFFLLAIFLLTNLFIPLAYASTDSDGDGIIDSQDNCLNVANPDQRNTNNDDFGNICDGDLNNDNNTNTLDLRLYKSAHRSRLGDSNYNPDADFNGDNKINTLDLNIYKKLHRKPPGPTGVNILTEAKAARFLTQSTFGTTQEDINHLLSLGSFDAWLNEQFSETISLQIPAMQSLMVKMCSAESSAPIPITGGDSLARAQAWWEIAVNNNDQLRQRVTLALSEIFVVSERGALITSQYGLASFNDLLSNHAFGNFRDLLKQVTLHPAMGRYLSMLRSEKADPLLDNHPDENYAREVMQLFTIGVHELNIDGSLALDALGNPIPTYNQQHIEEFAEVFTGWDFANAETGLNLWIGNGDTIHPMKAFNQRHDTSEKQLLNGFVITAGGTAEQDLEDALDHIFSHQNVAPFISKQLIQRLVTSNPTPAYIERIATVFNNNGTNVRGDLKAVVKAILLDDEARNGYRTMPESFGKVREPMLRFTHIWRAFPVIPVVLEGPFYGGNLCDQGEYDYYRIPYSGGLQQFDLTLGQTILRSPSVFNFFLPDYSPPGIIRDQSLVAPEFQIMSENNLVNTSNAIITQIHYSHNTSWRENWTTIDTSQLLSLAESPSGLLDHLNLILLNNLMSPELRQIILTHLQQEFLPNEELEAKVTDSIKLIVSSPEYLIQR